MSNLIQISCLKLKDGTHIIFVHGLFGDNESTWLCKESDPEFDWPKILESDLQYVKVWKFGYLSTFMGFVRGKNPIIENIAIQLYEEILKNEFINNKVIFISHSLGGIIVKNLIINLYNDSNNNNECDKILKQIEGVVFLSTPHNGSRYADAILDIVSKYNAFVSFFKFNKLIINDKIINQLTFGNEYLRNIDRKYTKIVMNSRLKNFELLENRVTMIDKHIFNLIDNKFKKIIMKTIGKKVLRYSNFIFSKIYNIREIVQENIDHMDNYYVENRKVDEDHITICKPRDRNCDVYKLVREFICSIIPNSSK